MALDRWLQTGQSQLGTWDWEGGEGAWAPPSGGLAASSNVCLPNVLMASKLLWVDGSTFQPLLAEVARYRAAQKSDHGFALAPR